MENEIRTSKLIGQRLPEAVGAFKDSNPISQPSLGEALNRHPAKSLNAFCRRL
jgi:hypothetical protein